MGERTDTSLTSETLVIYKPQVKLKYWIFQFYAILLLISFIALNWPRLLLKCLFLLQGTEELLMTTFLNLERLASVHVVEDGAEICVSINVEVLQIVTEI